MTPDQHRYEDLQAEASSVNHEVRIVVIPGKAKRGMQLTLKPFEVDAMSLDDGMNVIEEYLRTDEARRRGELYRIADEAEVQYLDAIKLTSVARKAWMEAEMALGQDIDEALDEATDLSNDDKVAAAEAQVRAAQAVDEALDPREAEASHVGGEG